MMRVTIEYVSCVSIWNGTPRLAQVIGQNLGREARLLLVEVDRDDVEGHRRAFAQRQQDLEQAVAVLPARQADHHLVAIVDHAEVADRLADLADQPLLELDVLARRLGRNPPALALRAVSVIPRP